MSEQEDTPKDVLWEIISSYQEEIYDLEVRIQQLQKGDNNADSA